MTVKYLFLVFLMTKIFCTESVNISYRSQQELMDDILNKPINLTEFPGENCYRNCAKSAPTICYFKWVAESYHTVGPACGNCLNGNHEDCFHPQCITADGIERAVMSTNRMIPGPTIQVCRDDFIIVDFTNGMPGTAAAQHWHGIFQRQTPHMDGVPFVTQCPVDFATTFRYAFKASEAGTHFYHSHAGHHKVNGQYGGLIVRDIPSRMFNYNLYDKDLAEHMIFISDWMEELGETFMPGLQSHRSNINPTSVLINGRGVKIDPITRKARHSVPIEVFRVQRGHRYRFRVVNGASHICQVQLEIEDHKLQIIATDAVDFEPVIVDRLISSSGERYDFVLHANRQKENYWMRVKLIGPCEGRNIEQFAILSYAHKSVKNIDLAFPEEPFPIVQDEFKDNIYFNHPNTTCNDPAGNSFCITDVASYVDNPTILNAVPDYKFYLAFNNYAQDINKVFTPNRYDHFMSSAKNLVLVGGMNNISLTFPPFSLLTQPEEIRDHMFCDADNLPPQCKPNEICYCIHRLKVKLNSIVEMVLVDEASRVTQMNHPFHLHGTNFYVVGAGHHPNGIPMTVPLAKSLDMRRSLRRFSFARVPPTKDTISIPSKGYSIIRFKADNPGFWMLHCHFEWHLAIGMGLVFQVGEVEEMVKPPKNFNKCNSFTPDIYFNSNELLDSGLNR